MKHTVGIKRVAIAGIGALNIGAQILSKKIEVGFVGNAGFESLSKIDDNDLNFNPEILNTPTADQIALLMGKPQKNHLKAFDVKIRDINNIDITTCGAGRLKTKEVIVSIKIKSKLFSHPVIIYHKEFQLCFYNKKRKMLTIS